MQMDVARSIEQKDFAHSGPFNAVRRRQKQMPYRFRSRSSAGLSRKQYMSSIRFKRVFEGARERGLSDAFSAFKRDEKPRAWQNSIAPYSNDSSGQKVELRDILCGGYRNPGLRRSGGGDNKVSDYVTLTNGSAKWSLVHHFCADPLS